MLSDSVWGARSLAQDAALAPFPGEVDPSETRKAISHRGQTALAPPEQACAAPPGLRTLAPPSSGARSAA
jgi:hypothetical protein